MDNNLKTPSKELGFVFDIIVVRINLPKIKDADTSNMKVNAKFNKNELKITSSRINTTKFKANSGLEFTEQPSILKDQLSKNPLECKVSYNDKVIGNCSFIWPTSFINCLNGDCSRELTHCHEGEIRNEKGVVGKLEVLIRLLIKCNEFEATQIEKPKVNLCTQSDIKVINPNDVLFVVAEDRVCSTLCKDIEIIPSTESSSSANRTCLDLSDFRHINGKTVANTDVLIPLDAACCKTKKSPNQFQQLIESLTKKAKQTSGCCKNPAKNEVEKFPWEQQTKSMDCLSDSRFASCSSSDSCNPCRCVSDENVSVDKCMIFEKDDDIKKPTRRYCALCHNNITWLPKFAACPRCGFKPASYNTEKCYDYKITANEIIQEYANKKFDNTIVQPGNTDLVASIPNSNCRCTCGDEQTCAHCRIKKLCEDIFQPPPKPDEDCSKCETNSSEMYNVCKSSSPDCRPYLAKVFQELKDLYETKDSKKKYNTESVKENNCEQTVSNRPYNNQKNFAVNNKEFLTNSLNKQKICKGKMYDKNTQHNYPGIKIGHKKCLNGFTGRNNVPRNMGWLWNAEANGLRTGWKPGAIRKPIKVLMQHFFNKRYPNSCDEIKSSENKKCEDEEQNYIHDATLHICKKNGVYYITLRPLKDPETLKECSDPYVNTKPIQFVISKNPLLLEMRKLKKYLKELGFSKCVCHKPISCCCCRSFLDKKKLIYQCQKECQKLQLPNVTESLILSDTTDSEVEFEFGVTPPAGVVRPKRCLKQNKKKVSTGTQYEADDLNIKKDYPKPLSKYLKLHNCAIGQRFGKQFDPYGVKGYSAGVAPIEGIYGPCGIIPENFNSSMGKYGKGGIGFKDLGAYLAAGKGGKGFSLKGPTAYQSPDGKFSMARYLAIKALTKPTPKEIAKRRKEKMALLKGANPPLLCTVDRRGKPIDVCSYNYNQLPCDPACLRDNRIC